MLPPKVCADRYAGAYEPPEPRLHPSTQPHLSQNPPSHAQVGFCIFLLCYYPSTALKVFASLLAFVSAREVSEGARLGAFRRCPEQGRGGSGSAWTLTQGLYSKGS